MEAKNRKQRNTYTPQHRDNQAAQGAPYFRGAPVATWTRQPSGVVQEGRVGTTTVSSSNNLTLPPERCDTTERRSTPRKQTTSIGKLYGRVKPEQQKGDFRMLLQPEVVRQCN